MKSVTLMIALAMSAAVALPANAADATLYRYDSQEDTLDVFATGALEHEPLYMVYTSEPYIVDACGNIHEVEEDRYGDRVIGAAITNVPALTDVVALQSSGSSAIGLMADGQMVKLDFAKYRWERNSTWPFIFAITDGTIPEAEVYLPADNAGRPLFVDDAGRLVYIDIAGASFNHLRRVEGVERFSNVVNGIHVKLSDGVATLSNEPNHYNFVLTLDGNGAASVTHLEIDNEDNVSGRTETFPGDYSGTRFWIGPGGRSGTTRIYRVADDGVIHAVSYPSAESAPVADASVYGKAITQDADDFYFINVQDASFASCPEPEAPAVEDEGPQFTGDAAKIVALDEELQRLYAEYEDDFDAIIGSHAMPDDIYKMDGPALEAAFAPILADLENFERDVYVKVRATYDALRESGEEEWMIREAIQKLTNGEYEMGGAYYNFSRDLEEYEKYRDSFGSRILSSGSTNFDIAEFQSDAKRAAELYLAAMPFAEWALKFSPDDEQAKQYLATAKEKAADVISAEKAAIASATWPEGKEDDFRGPGNADDLLQEVLDFMNEKSDRPLHEQGARFFAINMREDHWKVGRTNVLGEVTEYRLYLTVAQTMPEEPWFARVCDVEPATQENVKAPPFKTIMWGECRKMLLDKVEVRDEDLLEESLELIEEKTGLSPDDMPADALGTSVTGIDTGNAANSAAQPEAGGGTRASAPARNDAAEDAGSAAGGDAGSPATGVSIETGSGGSSLGWLFLLLLLGGGGAAAWYWQDKLPRQVLDLIGRFLPKR